MGAQSVAELLVMGLDEVLVMHVPVEDPQLELARLMHLIGQL